jgi:hypothetical protein
MSWQSSGGILQNLEKYGSLSSCEFTSVILARPHVSAVCRCILGWWLSIRSYGGGGDYYTGVRRAKATQRTSPD